MTDIDGDTYGDCGHGTPLLCCDKSAEFVHRFAEKTKDCTTTVAQSFSYSQNVTVRGGAVNELNVAVASVK